MHVASPGLPESALRHLFYRVATQAAPQPPSFRPSSGRVAGGGETTTSPRQRGASGGGGFGGGSGGRSGDGEPPPSTVRLARAIVEFPLACEGLAPLVEFTATDLAARNLLKQVAHQAKQALDEAERVRAIGDRCGLFRSCAVHQATYCKKWESKDAQQGPRCFLCGCHSLEVVVFAKRCDF